MADSVVRAPRGPAPETHPTAARLRDDRRDGASRELLLQRVLSEFREMPCLRLTAEQAERLLGLRSDVSIRILDTLVSQGDLRIDDDGRYAAASDLS